MTDRLPGLHLQRRTLRRKSTPASPTSPTHYHRKQAQSQDVSMPAPPFAETKANAMFEFDESPVIDLTFPSPNFDIPALTPIVSNGAESSRSGHSTSRASDDLSKSRPKFLGDITRPATSGANTISNHFRATLPPETAPSNSPPVGSQRTSGDGLRRPSSRDIQDEASLQRATTFWAQYDKSTADDSSSSKGTLNGKKSRFNLLSPMSLFARRRSSQNNNRIEDSSPNLHVPAISDKIETSIRGTIVHDFSAPRTRKYNNENSPRPGQGPSPSYPRRPSEFASPQIDSSVGTPASLHSPMFREHFHEEQRPVRPTETAYLHGQNLQVPDPKSLPTFAKNLPLTLPDTALAPNDATKTEVQDPLAPEPSPSEPDIPPTPPPKRTPSPVFEIPSKSALPKHTMSTSSRFSFLGQQGSIAQEKLMEAKHKEHASKNPAGARFSVVSMEDDDDYGDYDGLDDDDGFDTGEITVRNIDLPSSQIPQVPLVPEDEEYDFDEDEDDFGTGDIEIRNIDMPSSLIDRVSSMELDESSKTEAADNQHPSVGRSSKRHSLQAFHFTPQMLSHTPGSVQDPTPRDVNGFPIGLAQTEENGFGPGPEVRDDMEQPLDATFYEGLGISTVQPNTPTTLPTSGEFDDSDLYFDDGEFGDEIAEANGEFDEADLDDASQIRDIPAENARRYEEALQKSLPGEEIKAVPVTSRVGSYMRPESPNDAYSAMQESNQAGLTEDNLAAYHDALALAATKAAEDGKFNRAVSFSQVSDDETDSPFHNSLPGISSTGSRFSNNIVGSGISDDDGFGFDDDMDEDALIAAANAEALENDDDGFYGQEFGFYARAYDKDAADFTNGGYFASRGSNGLKRSHSGKNNYQEPSLTPITERSEWSTRNSVASLKFPMSAQSMPSPGLAQLLESDSLLNDDEMNLNALMKLRGKAFGGSSTSVNSLADRHLSHSSPLVYSSPYHRPGSADGGFRRPSPTPQRNYLDVPEFEDDDEEGGKLTLTQNTPHKKLSHPVRDNSHSSTEQVGSSPMSRRGNHSRNSSGGESVSYARDEDGRWVLERRRTGDSGELELVGREYLAGARI